jgi:hypothetical protein
MSENSSDGYREWSVVELMGHSMIAGLVSEQSIGGSAMVRVDVPAVDDQPGYTKFFSGGAIYAITPVSEEIAVQHVLRIRPPVQRFETRPVRRVAGQLAYQTVDEELEAEYPPDDADPNPRYELTAEEAAAVIDPHDEEFRL